jgi:hypothetical protein
MKIPPSIIVYFASIRFPSVTNNEVSIASTLIWEICKQGSVSTGIADTLRVTELVICTRECPAVLNDHRSVLVDTANSKIVEVLGVCNYIGSFTRV